MFMFWIFGAPIAAVLWKAKLLTSQNRVAAQSSIISEFAYRSAVIITAYIWTTLFSKNNSHILRLNLNNKYILLIFIFDLLIIYISKELWATLYDTDIIPITNVLTNNNS